MTTSAPTADRSTGIGYREHGSGLWVGVSTPAGEPQRWADYLAGALRSYRRHGVETVLELDRVADGRSTTLLLTVHGRDGRVLGGMRAQGPYREADESHAVAEWAGHPGQDRVRAMVRDRLPGGVVEGKNGWVADDAEHRSALARCLARGPLHAATLLGARYALGTTAEHTLAMWTSTGAVAATDLPPAPYPDARYRTTVIWWDRRTWSATATGEHRRAVHAESAELFRGSLEQVPA